MTWWEWYNSPGPALHVERIRDPYDVSSWGNGCGAGVAYADTGAPIASRQAGGVRKISTGRKHRGSSSADMERSKTA